MPTWSELDAMTRQAQALRTSVAQDQANAAFRVRQVYAALLEPAGEILVNDLVQLCLLNDSGGHLLTGEEKALLGQPGAQIDAWYLAAMQAGARRMVQRLLAMQREAPEKLREGNG